MVWGNQCILRDLLLWIVIVVSFSYLIFSRDISLVVCVFFLFSLLTTKMYNYHLFLLFVKLDMFAKPK
jgi:hypothetical protein